MRLPRKSHAVQRILAHRLRRQTLYPRGQIRRLHTRRTHIHGDGIIVIQFQSHYLAGTQMHANFALIGQTFGNHKLHKATRAVTAVLHQRTILIINRIFKVHAREIGFFHQQNLIRTNAEMTIGQIPPHHRRDPRQILRNTIGDNEIIARAMHFAKFQFHNVLT